MKAFTLKQRMIKTMLLIMAVFFTGNLFAQSVSITTPSAASVTIAAGGSVPFTASRTGTFAGSGNVTWTWAASPAAGVTYSGTNPVGLGNGTTTTSNTLTFANPGTYTVTITASRSTTTVVSAAKTVYVLAAPSAAGAPNNSPNPCVNGGTAITTTTCPQGSFSASFTGGQVNINAGNSGLAAGSVWRFTNVANIDGDQINATIKVDTLFRAVLTQMDDNSATDENGNQTLQAFFAPRIDPEGSLGSTNQNGYVQFTIEFWKNGWVDTAKLDGIRYSHYDIDGTIAGTSNNPPYWFRETGVVKNNFGAITTIANANTELTSYSYVQGGNTWSGFAGSICDRSNFSRYAEVAASFIYPIKQSSVTIRMGYDYQKRAPSGTYGNPAARLYASKFECFSFPEEIVLPVKLLSFSGSFRNQATTLSWETVDEQNFTGFEIERSNNASTFIPVGIKAAQAGGIAKKQYQHLDDLSSDVGTVFYYRLKMLDADGRFKYSNVIMIRKDSKSLNGVTINPNPVVSGGMATIRFSSPAMANVDFSVVDLSGKVLLRQQAKVYEGNNSVALNNLDRLQPGIYMLQLANGSEITSVKFSVTR